MDAVNFSILAPRFGSHPMMSSYSGIGTSGMNGGAFNWGGIWSGIKNFGSSIKSWGSKAWNSQTGKLLRQKLNDTNVREKLVEGISTGVHGALDIANQEIAKQIEKRLERREPVDEVEVEEEIVEKKPAPLVVDVGKKRPRDEDLIITTDEPPSYEEATMSAPLRPMTRPIHPMARPVLPDKPTTLELKPTDLPPPYSPPKAKPVPKVVEPAPVVVAPPPPVVEPAPAPSVVLPAPIALPSRRGWQGTLANIVGVGLRGVKRRRCY